MLTATTINRVHTAQERWKHWSTEEGENRKIDIGTTVWCPSDKCNQQTRYRCIANSLGVRFTGQVHYALTKVERNGDLLLAHRVFFVYFRNNSWTWRDFTPYI